MTWLVIVCRFGSRRCRLNMCSLFMATSLNRDQEFVPNVSSPNISVCSAPHAKPCLNATLDFMLQWIFSVTGTSIFTNICQNQILYRLIGYNIKPMGLYFFLFFFILKVILQRSLEGSAIVMDFSIIQ